MDDRQKRYFSFYTELVSDALIDYIEIIFDVAFLKFILIL